MNTYRLKMLADQQAAQRRIREEQEARERRERDDRRAEMTSNSVMMALQIQMEANARGNNRVMTRGKPNGHVSVQNLHGPGQHLLLQKGDDKEPLPASPVSSIDNAVHDPPTSPSVSPPKKKSPKGKKSAAKKKEAPSRKSPRGEAERRTRSNKQTQSTTVTIDHCRW